MSEIRTLSVGDKFIGMPVLAPHTSRKLGVVSDAIVHPTDGKVLGIALLTPEGKQLVLTLGEFQIGTETVTAAESALRDPNSLEGAQAGGAYVCRELVGAKIVTDEGELLGRVNDVYISADCSNVIYRVAHSTSERLFGSFFMDGSVPHSYSREGTRLMVPVDTETRYAVRSLDKARLPPYLRAWGSLRVAHARIPIYGLALVFITLALLVTLALSLR